MIVFFIAPIASKLAILSKTFKTEKYFNIKPSLLCFTFNVFCFIAIFARKKNLFKLFLDYFLSKVKDFFENSRIKNMNVALFLLVWSSG